MFNRRRRRRRPQKKNIDAEKLKKCVRNEKQRDVEKQQNEEKNVEEQKEEEKLKDAVNHIKKFFII